MGILMDVQSHEFLHVYKKTGQALNVLTQGNDKVLAKYADFIGVLQIAIDQGYLSKQNLPYILDALIFAAKKHEGQTRKDKERTPYIIHPIGVAYNIIMIGKVYDVDIIIGALLHDTVEDTHTTFEEIRQYFGLKIESLIHELTDDKSLSKEERKRLQIEHAPHTSTEAAIIKLSDKLYNLNDLLYNTPLDWSQERIAEYFKWAQQVVDHLPSANQSLKTAIDTLIKNFMEKH